MPHIKAQVTFQGATAIPEDRFINTFHFFQPIGTLAAAAAEIGPALASFYGTVEVPAAAGMGQFLSQFVLRPFTIKFYDQADAEPRVPVELPYTLTAYSVAATYDLPEEVAVCLSFHTDPPVTARRRGRIFLGPLNSITKNDATATVPTRTADSVRSQGCTQMAALAAADVGWSVYSPTSGLLHTVTGGWVDNAFDTQRRRGPDSTARNIWPAP